MKRFSIAMLSMVIVLALSLVAGAFESKWATTAAGATIANTYGPSAAGFMVKNLYATSDKAASLVKFYAKGGGEKLAITTASTSGAQVVYCSNADQSFTNSDVVIYKHANGTLLATTISSVTTGTITLATGITLAGTTEDVIYEVTEQNRLACGATTVNPASGYIWAVPGDSPLYITLDSGTNGLLSTTTDR